MVFAHTHTHTHTFKPCGPFPRKGVSGLFPFNFSRSTYSHSSLPDRLAEILAKNWKIIILTAHRRENHGEPLGRIFSAIRKIAETRNDTVLYVRQLNEVHLPRYLWPEFGHRVFSDIKRPEVLALRDGLAGRGYRSESCNRVVAVFIDSDLNLKK